jgi:2-polyprenyl-3-methyl-5-hydroxy-6-metoxy-1,4-benzoquinol methylase
MNLFFNQNRSKAEALSIYQQRVDDAKRFYELYHESFSLRNCPYCDEKEFTQEEKFLDMYGVARCSRCNSVYVNPVPSKEGLSIYYNKFAANTLLDNLFRKRSKKKKKNIVNNSKLTEVLKLIQTIEGPIRILEIGCGSGSFLSLLDEYLKEEGRNDCELHGLDIDAGILGKNSSSNLTFHVGDAEDFKLDQKFDVIISFEVIEHVLNPTNMIQAIRAHLKDGGYAFLTTPNSLGFEIKALSYNGLRLLAHSIFPPMHINAFNPQNMTYFLLNNGLKIRKIETPGIFDTSIIQGTLEEMADEEKDPFLVPLETMSPEVSGYIQKVVSYLYGSSHMILVAQV